MDDQAPLTAVESLLTEVSGALADLVQAAHDGQANSAEISATLIDLLAVLARRPDPVAADPLHHSELIEAIRAIRLDKLPAASVTVKNTVQVAPTPIENIVQVAPAVVQVIERAPPVDYDMDVVYDTQGRITKARLLAKPRKALA